MSGNESKPISGISWKTVLAILGSISIFIGAVVSGLDFITYLREGYQPFLWLVLAIIGVIWLILLWLLFKQRSAYGLLWLSVTILASVVGGVGWRSYHQTQEDKVIVLVAQFDGHEDQYHLRDEVLKQLDTAAREYGDIVISPLDEVIGQAKGSEYARTIGKKRQADLVIWGWYTETEISSINIYLENLSPDTIVHLEEREEFQSDVSINDLETLKIQKQLGSGTRALLAYIVGVMRYEAGDYETALDGYLQALNGNETNAFLDTWTILLSIGNCQVQLNQYEDAIRNYTLAIEIHPAFANAYNNRGLAYILSNQKEYALQDFDKAIEIDPEYADAYSNRGNYYFLLPNYKQAISDFSKAIELDPQHAIAYNNRGSSYYAAEEYELSVLDFNKSIELDPHYVLAHYNRGMAYRKLEKFKRSIKDFNKAIQLDSDYTNAHIGRGLSRYDIGDYERCIQDYDKAIELNPDYADTYNFRAIVHQTLGNLEEAETDFKKYEELAGKKP